MKVRMFSVYVRTLCLLLYLVFATENLSLREFLTYKNGYDYKRTFSGKTLEGNSKKNLEHFGPKSKNTLHSRRVKRDSFSDDPCYENGLCKSNNDTGQAFCYCDRYCAYYGDCCYDVNFNDIDVLPELPKLEHHKCVCNNYKDPFKCYNMVTKCSVGYQDKEIIKQCGTILSLSHELPVFDDKGVTYFSAFCAMCNNVTNYIPAQVTFDVKKCFKSSLIYKYQLNETQCKPTFNPPKGLFFRNCVILGPGNINEKCSRYQNPIYKESWQKNYFCSIPDDRGRFDNYKCSDTADDNTLHDMQPLTVMFTFLPPRVTSDRGACNKDETYSDKLKMCIKTSCESGMELQDGICLEPRTYTNYEFDIDYRFFINNTVEHGYLSRISEVLFQNLRNEKYQLRARRISCVMTHGLQEGSENNCSDIKAQVMFFGNMYHTIKTINVLKSTMSDFNMTYLEKIESYEQITKLNTFLSFNRCNQINNVTFREYLVKREEEQLDVKISQDDINIPQFCSDVHIEAMLSKNGSTKITLRKCRKLSETKFFNNTSQSHLRFVNSQTILTYVCMGLSCIALITSIVIYRVLDLSKSIPGSNTENLYITLLFAHVLFLIGIGATDNQTVCLYVGIAIHYFWLASFAFMTISVLHITVTFFRILKNPNLDKTLNRCLKRKLVAAGYILPILIVFPCVLLDFLKIPFFQVEYSGSICFPTGYPANIIFVSGPMALSIVLNVIFLFITICSIQRLTANNKQIDKCVISYMPVYLRLSLLVGILWIFGILSAVITNEILENIFIALGSLHGFFVSFACTCTKSIYNSFKLRLRTSSSSSQLPMENRGNIGPK